MTHVLFILCLLMPDLNDSDALTRARKIALGNGVRLPQDGQPLPWVS